MTAEELITKLIDEDKITGEEAVILLKLVIKAGEEGKEQDISVPKDIRIPGITYPEPSSPWKDVVVMYGVQTYPSYTKAGDIIDVSSADSAYTSSTSYNPIRDRQL